MDAICQVAGTCGHNIWVVAGVLSFLVLLLLIFILMILPELRD